MLNLGLLVLMMNLEGIEPSSPEPESDVISITLQVQYIV